MHPNPALEAAALSPMRMAAAQQRGLDAARKWRSLPAVQDLTACLERLNDQPPETAAIMADHLMPWLDDLSWLDALMETQLAALAEDPLTAVQFRLIQGRVAHGLLLLHCGGVEVTLSWVDAAVLPHALDRHVLFTSAFSTIRIVHANGLVARRYHRTSETNGAEHMRASPPVALGEGEVLAMDCRTESLGLVAAAGDAVVLRFNLALPSRAPQQAFACDTGLPVGAAMGDDGASRMLPLLALARLTGTASRAGPLLADLIHDSDPVLRWAAMREYLVADTAAAIMALQAMAAGDEDREVRRAAARTFDLLSLKGTERCPA